MVRMMQGDSYHVKLKIAALDGTVITSEMCVCVEVTLGKITRTWPDGGVRYRDGYWYMPLTQKQTFSMALRPQEVQARVSFRDGKVIGGKGEAVRLSASLSRAILPQSGTSGTGENGGAQETGARSIKTVLVTVEAASVEINGGGEEYQGPYAVVPQLEDTVVLRTNNKRMADDVTVSKIPTYEVSNTAGGNTFILGVN
nr:MAG TPA: hypothetical protein [Caudoviricetes sp.]